MSVDPDKHFNDTACASGSEKITIKSGEFGDPTNYGKDGEKKAQKAARSVRFPEEDQLVTQYFEPANPWQDVPSTTRAQLAAEYLESCRRHNTPCIDSVLQQIRELPESSIGGACRAARLTLSECTVQGAAPADTLEALLRKVQFRTLELHHAVLDDEAAEAIFDMIEYYESANVVSISGPRQFGIRGWQAASRMIKKSAELSELEVSDSPLEASHAPVLARALKPHSCRLRALCLQRVALSGEPLLCLVIALKSNSSVRELRLGDNGLGASDAAQLAALLRFNTRVQLLDLSNNQIQDAGVGHIAEALVEQAAQTPPSAAASPLSPHHCLVSGYESRGLAFLVLWNNQLTRNCAPHLSKALRSSQSLCVLNVGRNALGTDGVRALSHSAALMSLGLQAARLGTDAAAAIAELIHADTELQRLDLRENRLGCAGLQAILTALKDNTTLTQIDLDDPPESTTLTAEDNEVGLVRRLTLEIRALCRRNETATRRDEHGPENALHRKISLTCHTACLLRGMGVEEERRNVRLRSPAPSPAPSPAGSPVPAPHSHSRFSVKRVTPDRESSADSCSPPAAARPTYCPTPSRFKVVQVMEPPQIQVHPATTSQPRKTSSRFSVTRNYDTIYNSTPTPSPPPPSPGPHATTINITTPPITQESRTHGCQKPATTDVVLRSDSCQPETTESVIRSHGCQPVTTELNVRSHDYKPITTDLDIRSRGCQPITTEACVRIYGCQQIPTEPVTISHGCLKPGTAECSEKFEDTSCICRHQNVDKGIQVTEIVDKNDKCSERLQLQSTNKVVTQHSKGLTQPVTTGTKIVTQHSKEDIEPTKIMVVENRKPCSTRPNTVKCQDKSVQVPHIEEVSVAKDNLAVEHRNEDKSIQMPSPLPNPTFSYFDTVIDDHNKTQDRFKPPTTILAPKSTFDYEKIEDKMKPKIEVETKSVTTQTYDSIGPSTFSKTTVKIEPLIEPKNIKLVMDPTSTNSVVNTQKVDKCSVSVQTDKLIISDHDVIVDSIKLVKSDVTYSDIVRNDKNIDKCVDRSHRSETSVVKNDSKITDSADVEKRVNITEESKNTREDSRNDSKIIREDCNTRSDMKITKEDCITRSDTKITKEELIITKDEMRITEVDSKITKDEDITEIKSKMTTEKCEITKHVSEVKKNDSIITKESSNTIEESKTTKEEVQQTKVDTKVKIIESKIETENSGDSKIERQDTKGSESSDKDAIKQIAAITQDLDHIILEMKDLTHKNVRKETLVPTRDNIVLKKNKSESSLDSPDLEVSRLMNKRLIGSPFDSNSSLEISESSMESLNDKPTIQEPTELDRRRLSQVLSNESSMESTSETTPVNSNLLNLSLSSTESVSPIFGKNKKIHDSLSSLEASVSSLESTKQEKIMVTSADSGIEYSLQNPADNKEDNSSNEGTLTNNSSLKETVKKSECFQLLESLTSSPKRTSSLLDMPALKSKGLDRMRKISWVAPSSSFHIPRQDDKDVKPSHLEKLLSLFQHPSSIFSRTNEDEKKCHTPPRKDSSLTSSFWSWGSTVERDKDDDSENTDSTLSERVQVSFVDESFSKKLDSKTPSTDTDNTLSEFQPLPTQEVTVSTDISIVQNVDLSLDNIKKDSVKTNEKSDEELARPRSFAAVLKSSGSENSLDRQTSPDNGQPVDKLPSKVIRGIKENISPENTLISSMSNTKALAVELAERQIKIWDSTNKNEAKVDENKSDLAPIATIEETCDDLQVFEDKKDDKKDCIDLGKDALSYLIYENRKFEEQSLADELKDAEIKEMLDLSPELVMDETLQAPIFAAKDVISIRTSPVIPDRAKIKSNSLEDLSQLQTEEKGSPKAKTIAFKVPESTTPRDIPKRSKLRSRSGSSPKSLPESLNKPCPLNKMESILNKKKKKVSSLGKMARDSLLALNMSVEELAEFRRSYKLTSVESLKSLESVSEDANSQSGNSVDSRCRSCLRTSQESLMSLDSITEDCKCTEDCGRSAKSGR